MRIILLTLGATFILFSSCQKSEIEPAKATKPAKVYTSAEELIKDADERLWEKIYVSRAVEPLIHVQTGVFNPNMEDNLDCIPACPLESPCDPVGPICYIAVIIKHTNNWTGAVNLYGMLIVAGPQGPGVRQLGLQQCTDLYNYLCGN